MSADRTDRVALSPNGQHVAVRSYRGDSWFVVDTARVPGTFQSSLPDDWTLYVPATTRDRAADELDRIADEMESAAASLALLVAGLPRREATRRG